MSRISCMRCHLLGKTDPQCQATRLRNALREIKCELSTEALMIVQLINSLAANAFNDADFDCSALPDFLSQPTLILPLEWAPLMGEITELVTTSIERIHKKKKESSEERDTKST